MTVGDLINMEPEPEDEYCQLALHGTIDVTGMRLNVEDNTLFLGTDGAIKLTLTADDGETLLEVRLTKAQISGTILELP